MIDKDIIRDELICCLSVVLKKNKRKLDTIFVKDVTQMNSLQLIHFISKIESKFNIKINDDLFSNRMGISDLCRLIKKNKNIHKNISIKKRTHFPKIHRGLKNIYIDKTKICHIDGKNSLLKYRGYAIQNLVEEYSFENVVNLLIDGKISSNHVNIYSLKQNHKWIKKNFEAKYINNHSHFETLKYIIQSPEMKNLIKINKITSFEVLNFLKQVIHIFFYISSKKNIYDVNFNLGIPNIISNFILQKNHRDERDKIIEKIMILQAEHGLNASTFTARIATSSEANCTSALAAALNVFEGKIHGGAITRSLDFIHTLNSSRNISFIDKALDEGIAIPGFGHRVYKNQDPRAIILRKIANKICQSNSGKNLLHTLEMAREKIVNKTNGVLDANVDLYVGIIFKELGVSKNMLLPIFAISRLTGWIAHIKEQNTNNILIRPRLFYDGK
ncbi:MAG: hypothetical protein KDC90_08090 [Ignavibacteriae bacterium]|nr:hypothetical protein [Ignavibacteriota bacterium]